MHAESRGKILAKTLIFGVKTEGNRDAHFHWIAADFRGLERPALDRLQCGAIKVGVGALDDGGTDDFALLVDDDLDGRQTRDTIAFERGRVPRSRSLYRGGLLIDLRVDPIRILCEQGSYSQQRAYEEIPGELFHGGVH